MIYGEPSGFDADGTWTFIDRFSSFDPGAESNCEELLKSALQVDPENTEALQTLASVRMSQQKPDEAKEILEKAWLSWKDLDAGTFELLSSARAPV
jgi:thioredoxin-like negative regulator of GroEL